MDLLDGGDSQSRNKIVPLFNPVLSPAGLDHDCCNVLPLLEHLQTDQHLHLSFVVLWAEQLVLIFLAEVKSLLFVVFVVKRYFALHLSNLAFDPSLAQVILLHPVFMALQLERLHREVTVVKGVLYVHEIPLVRY